MENTVNNKLSSLTINTDQSVYDTNYEVIYEDTKEYRECMRHLFKMTPLIQDSDLDDETLDEQNYDSIQTTIMLDYIYALTKDNKCFQKMYDYASATMFSQDREIGLAVLFSFDYFIFFHPCICSYIKMPHRMSETNEYFIELVNRFIR
jgi:hypothetical protein